MAAEIVLPSEISTGLGMETAFPTSWLKKQIVTYMTFILKYKTSSLLAYWLNRTISN